MNEPLTNDTQIHDSDTCACDQCVWASQQEAEQVQGASGFPAVLNTWTDTLLAINRTLTTASEIALVARLGLLGQQSIYTAYAIGENEGLKAGLQMMQEREL